MAGETIEIDHYLILCLPSGEEGAKLTLDQIEKAYKSQSRLRHPDKRPDDPNATADFQQLRSSYDFLKDEQLRRGLDAKLRARREREVRDVRRDGKRRQMVSDLEERERRAERGEEVGEAEKKKRKEKSVARELERELDEFMTSGLRKEGAVPSRTAGKGKESSSAKENNLESEKVLKVSWERNLGDYTAIKLREIFEKFGKVEDVIIRSKKSKTKCTALVVMSSRDAVVAATRSMCGNASNPLLVLPLKSSSNFDGFSAPFNESKEPEISKVVGAGFNDFEASILKKLQQANKNKQPKQ
ncbi:hypothetical protein LUZ60_006476 [Juncus effusus]|nr:hypothetical protein LUZ60_006476 [Juncus effusus]